MADGSVIIKINADDKNASKTFDKIDKALGGLPQKANKVTGSFKGMLTAILSSKAIVAVFNTIKSSLDGAIKRFDTLQNAGKVFENMGFEAGETKTMMDNLNKSIDGLPTPLDEAVQGVQTLASSTGDLGKSEEVYSSLNNAVLGFGGSNEQVNSVVGMFSRSLQKGKVQGDEFNTMMDNMGPVMNAVAEEMGLTTEQMREGLSNGSVDIDDFTDTLIRMNEEGGGGLASLDKMARDMTGGIATSITTMKIAVVRGVTGVIKVFDDWLEAEGFGGISGVVDKIKITINEMFEAVKVALPAILDWFSNLFSTISESTAFQTLKEIIGQVLEAGEGLIQQFLQSEAWALFKEVLGEIAQAILDIDFTAMLEGLQEFIEKWEPLILGIMGAATAYGIYAAALAIKSGAETIAIASMYAFEAAVIAVKTVMAFFSGGIGLAILVIGALIAVGVLLYKNWDTIKEKLSQLKDKISKDVEHIKNVWNKAWSAVGAYLSETWDNIKTTVSNAITNVKTTISNGWDNVKTATTTLWNSVVTAVTGAWTNVKTAVSDGIRNAYDTITGWFSNFKDAGKNLIGNIASGIKEKINSVKDAVGSVLQRARDLLPFSPPKDKSSPLADIHKNGITDQIAKGIYDGESEIDKALKSALDIDTLISGVNPANVKLAMGGGASVSKNSQNHDNRVFNFNANANGTERNEQEFYERLFREFKYYISQEGGAFNG